MFDKSLLRCNGGPGLPRDYFKRKPRVNKQNEKLKKKFRKMLVRAGLPLSYLNGLMASGIGVLKAWPVVLEIAQLHSTVKQMTTHLQELRKDLLRIARGPSI